ncbi:MAG: hypothetical protein D6706_09775 [Chloroflexi bacterium]|nr:MAG: hypothetical protein D6706_09775 [Chloroflexota bacterium]
MRRKLFWWMIVGILLLAGRNVSAQETAELRLRLTRDFGFSAGLRIQGTFSYRVEGPESLVRVVFLLDGEPVAEDTEPPFRWQFHTDDFPTGVHTMSALGYTADGRELTSNVIQRTFVTGSESWRVMLYIIVPLLVLVIGGRWLSGWIVNRNRQQSGKPVINGLLGGTICPNCERPFAIHWWSFNFTFFRIDRCPHCGKWSRVRRVHPDALAEALDALETAESTDSPLRTQTEENLRQQLDDSRFTDT